MIKFLPACVLLFLSCAPSHKEIISISLAEDTVVSHPGINNNSVKDKEINVYTDTINEIKYTNRLLLKFNEIILTEKQRVDSVFLYMYYNNRSHFFKNNIKGHKGTPELSVQRIISDWNPETTTWKDNLQLAPQKVIKTVKASTQDIRINITPLIVEGGQLSPFKGLFLKLRDEHHPKYVHLTSINGYEIKRVSKLKIYVTNN